MSTDLPVLKPADFASDQDVRWCPGCGDYSILAQMKKVLAELGAARENTVFISGMVVLADFRITWIPTGFTAFMAGPPRLQRA